MIINILPLLQIPSAVNNYVSAGSIYTEQTIAVITQLLVILAISMQIARGYFLRVLRKFTLRMAADVWWLMFIVLRDASIFLVVFLGFQFFWPGTYQDYAIAVPFQPLAVVFFAFALVVLLIKDTDEDPLYNSVLTILVLIGAVLYITGTVFVTESAASLAILPPTVATSSSNIWGFMLNTFSSQNNPALSIYTFYACFGLLSLAGLIAIAYSFKGGIPRKSIETVATPIVKHAAQPTAPAPMQQTSEQQNQQNVPQKANLDNST